MSNSTGVLFKAGTAFPSQAHEFTPGFFCGFRVAYLFTFCVVLLFVFTFWVSCCDARYDFRMESMCGSFLLQVVCGGPVSCLCYLCLFACDGVQCVLCCVFTLIFFVLCALCCQFLLIVHL